MSSDTLLPSPMPEHSFQPKRFRIELTDGGFADCEPDTSLGFPAVDVQWVEVPEGQRKSGKGAALFAAAALESEGKGAEVMFSEIGHPSAIGANFQAFGDENLHFIRSDDEADTEIGPMHFDEAKAMFDQVVGTDGGLRVVVSLKDPQVLEHASQYLESTGITFTVVPLN